jgi:hypothetical protein
VPSFILLQTMIKASEEAMNEALIRELCSGRQFLDSLQKRREIEAAQEAKIYRNLGRQKGAKMVHLAEVPQREYLQMAQKYGAECWNDREFISDYQKYEPTMASNKISLAREI